MSAHKRPIPYGFAEVADKDQLFLMREFHCSQPQITRWRAELGISYDRNTMRRAVLMCDHDGRVIKRFKSVHDAAKELYGSASNVASAARGKTKTAYGYC